ncbi:MAG: tRNA pseudouridine(55) synthase TruB [Clostridia bacterium]|nr:tRNA pseudouridine(55) synthase TruB [Clostridia bacterium]
MDGIINVHKPPGMTSHDVVSFIRRTFRQKRVGHTGTLDPGVAGVLPICLGKATRVAQFLTDQDKAYRGELTLGFTTDTLDGFGQFTGEKDASRLTEDEIRQALVGFIGEIEQIPPMVSAVRHQGKKLYELARAGVEVERRPRKVTIHSLEILEIEGLSTAHPKVSFDVVCSKGTYIRTLCDDIGARLGVGGYMSHLVRTRSGPFTLATAHPLEIIEEAVQTGNYQQVVLAIESGLTHLLSVKVWDSAVKAVSHGNPLFEPGVAEKPETLQEGQLIRLHGLNEEILAVAKVIFEQKDNQTKIIFQPIVVFI